MDEKFNIENCWKKYLNMTGQDESKMPPIQIQETKRAFYGAFGQMLTMFEDDFMKLKEEDAAEVLEQWINQVANFWIKETQHLN